MHVSFIHFAPAFAVIACRAGCNEVGPTMPAAHVAWNDVVDGEVDVPLAAILTGIIVAPEYFAAC